MNRSLAEFCSKVCLRRGSSKKASPLCLCKLPLQLIKTWSIHRPLFMFSNNEQTTHMMRDSDDKLKLLNLALCMRWFAFCAPTALFPALASINSIPLPRICAKPPFRQLRRRGGWKIVSHTLNHVTHSALFFRHRDFRSYL